MVTIYQVIFLWINPFFNHHLCWRLFIFSIDGCNGTGDHENYFKDITDAYEINGTQYTNCRKKFVSYRSRNEHKPVSALIENDFMFHHPETGYFLFLFQEKLRINKEVFDPKFSWVVIIFSVYFSKLNTALSEVILEVIVSLMVSAFMYQRFQCYIHTWLAECSYFEISTTQNFEFHRISKFVVKPTQNWVWMILTMNSTITDPPH